MWPRSPISATAEVLFSNAYEASVLSLQRGGEEQQDGDETLSSAESLLRCITRHIRRDAVVSFSSLPRNLPRRIIYQTCRCVQCTPAVIMVALCANLECRSEMRCTRLAANAGRKKSPSRHHRTTLSGHILATKACIDNRKKNC